MLNSNYIEILLGIKDAIVTNIENNTYKPTQSIEEGTFTLPQTVTLLVFPDRIRIQGKPSSDR